MPAGRHGVRGWVVAAALAASPAALLALTPTGLASGRGIAAAPDGGIWVGATVRHPDGTYDTLRVPVELGDLAVTADGTVWGVEGCGRVVRVTPAGWVTTFPEGARSAAPGTECPGRAIVAAPDGNVWFTLDHYLGRMTLNPPGGADGCDGEPVIAGPRDEPTAATCGIWSVRRMPVFTNDLAAGADGTLWFTSSMTFGSVPAVVRFDAATGTTQVFRTGDRYGAPFFVTVAPDGAAWFTTTRPDMTPAHLGRVGPDGGLRWVTLPGVRTDFDITTGPDGALWFPCSRGTTDAICRYDPSTQGLRTFRRPQTDYEGAGIVAGADGALWFTEGGIVGAADGGGSRVARMTVAGAVREFPALPLIRGVRAEGTSRVRVRLRCPAVAEETCAGALTLARDGSGRRLGATRYRLAPGDGALVDVPLWAPGRRELRRRGRLRIVVTADPPVLGAWVARTVTLRAR